MFRGCNAKREVRRTITSWQDSATYWRDQYGREHVRRSIVQAERDMVRALYPTLLDSMARLLKVRPKQIRTIAGVSGKATDTVKVPTYIPYADTTAGSELNRCFTYRDDYTALQGCVDTGGEATMIYSIEVPVTLTTFYKRRWFLGRKRWYVDGSSANPAVSLTGLQGLEIK